MCRYKKYFAILLAVVIAVSATSTSAWAKAVDQRLDFSSELELVSAKYLAPTSTLGVSPDAQGNVSGSINFTFDILDDYNCLASGNILNGANKLEFNVSGNVVFAGDKNDLAFSTMQGLVSGDIMTMVLAHDYTSNKQYASIAIGRLTETEIPLQMEFGELTDRFSDYYAMCATNTALEEFEEPVISPRISTDNIKYIGDDTAKLPNGVKCLVQSTYFPETAVRNTGHTVASKLTTDSTAIINYLKTIDSTAKSLKIQKATIKTGSSNSGFRNIDQAPDESSNTVTVRIPYLTSIDKFSVGFKTLDYIVNSTSFTRSPSSNPTWVEHTFDLGMFVFPDWPKIDWGSNTPKQAPSGMAVNNVFSYQGNVGSAGVKVYVQTSSTMTVGYYTVLPNGRTDYHTFALDDLSVNGYINIRDAS